jgi:hypothetical protein
LDDPESRGDDQGLLGAGQSASTMRFLTISVRGPNAAEPRAFRVSSNASDWPGQADERGTPQTA